MNDVEKEVAAVMGTMQLEMIKLRAVLAQKEAEIEDLKETIKKVEPIRKDDGKAA